MTETNWDTDEVVRIIINDEGLYSTTLDIAESVDMDEDDAAEILIGRIENEFYYIIEEFYPDVDIDEVDWTEVARDCIMEA